MSTQPNDSRTQSTTAAYAPSAQTTARRGSRPRTRSNSTLAPSRSWTSAGSTASPQIRPSVSTRMWRLRPPIFFSRVVPPGSAGLGRLDGLTVDDAGGGRRLAAGAGAGVAAQGGVDLRP